MTTVLLAYSAGWWVAYAVWLALLVVAVGERIAEVVVSNRNARWAFEQGGREAGRAHFPPMVALHIGLGVGCAAEPLIAGRPFIAALAVPAVVVVLAAQGLRWWCIGTLGKRWNTRIIVVPGMPMVERGPYRLLQHPNYVAVVLEGIALPLVATAWATAVAFTLLNAVLLLGFRIPAEERALAAALTEEPVR